jgi:hypothetical protein
MQTCSFEHLTRRYGALYFDTLNEFREPYWHGYIGQAEAASWTKNTTYLSERCNLVTPMMK